MSDVHSISSSIHHLSIYYQNVRGVRTKTDSLRIAVSLCSYDLLIFSETWLVASINSAELGFMNYTVYRFDRNPATSDSQRGGGVLIAVINSIKSTLIDTKLDTVEHVCVKLNFFQLYL